MQSVTFWIKVVYVSSVPAPLCTAPRSRVLIQDRVLSIEPTFISVIWVRRKEDKDQEKIYLFFREKNSDSSPDADPWISRVARVCKVLAACSRRGAFNTLDTIYNTLDKSEKQNPVCATNNGFLREACLTLC